MWCGCRQLKLKDSVVSALRFCKAKEIELAWIDALLDLSHAKTDTGCVTDDGDLSDNKGTEYVHVMFAYWTLYVLPI